MLFSIGINSWYIQSLCLAALKTIAITWTQWLPATSHTTITDTGAIIGDSNSLQLKEMHQEAEYGLAAHLTRKEDLNGNEICRKDTLGLKNCAIRQQDETNIDNFFKKSGADFP